MTPEIVTALLYLMTGAAVVYLFQERRKGLARLRHEQIQELSEEDFASLILLLKTAYERMLYLGVLFFPLGLSTLQGGNRVSTLFFLLLIILLFLSNLGPRHKVMALLEQSGLHPRDLRARGIRL